MTAPLTRVGSVTTPTPTDEVLADIRACQERIRARKAEAETDSRKAA